MRRRFMSDTGFKESFDYNNYMTIEALEDDTSVSFTSDIEYGIDGQGWRRLPYGSKVIVNAGQFLSFKGEFTPSTSNIPYYGIGTFTISKNCNLIGNCMSLLFGDDAVNNNSLSGITYAFYKLFSGCTTIIQVSETFLPATTLDNHCYGYMFNGCTSLTTAPELPANVSYDWCYSSMFEGCTSLTKAPELPATTLTNGCYSGMFSGCTSLTQAPELPITTLAGSCYATMFSGCTSLVTVPALPATTLTRFCYSGMFRGCTSLIKAPELPATTLEQYCYHYMFYGCSSLTTAPELPATTLAKSCYEYMFSGCSKLNYIKMLAIYISVSDCLFNWVSDVPNTGTFVKNPEATWDVVGDSGVPSGWTVKFDGEEEGDDIFPMSLYLTKVSSLEYRHEPSKESIALADYILKHAVYDGLQTFDLYLQEGQLYIDDLPVTFISFSSYGSSVDTIYETAPGWESKKRYFSNEYRYIGLGISYTKGLISVQNDD